MKSSGIGGQAVLEGIMMKNGDHYAVAVRTPDDQVALKVGEYHMFSGGRKWARLPVIRGFFNFMDSMILGMQTLTYSAGFLEEETKEDSAGKTGSGSEKENSEKTSVALMAALAVVLAAGIFMALPVVLVSFFRGFVQSAMLIAFLEGLVRIGIFLAYVALISRMEDIRRVYMYHGAEHKCINCVEHGMELNVENVMKCSRLHKRCGTSFLLIVMLISVVFFMLIRVETLWVRILTRILFIPLIAGVSYEFIRLAGNSSQGWINILSGPGLCLQKLTTREPDEGMVQVAITAVEAVFNWKEYLAENFQ